MQKLNKHIRFLFYLSLGMSIGFPVGVVGIVFGAIHMIVPLLVIGILLAIAGFYVMPIMWVKYADSRHDRTLLLMIEREYLYTVDSLAMQSGFKPDDVRARIKRMILSQVLVGYLFENDELRRNTNRPQMGNEGTTRECPNCCAPMRYENHVFVCDYCHTRHNAD